jgi:hypothetical protein
MLCQRIEYFGILFGPLGREVVPWFGADIDCGLPAFRHGKRCHLGERDVVQPLLPFLVR